uniref:Uncharacterized protein n=1 Tax=Meloidogyne enterolobii TaxID=390850 RepID=A0A6V7WCU4_MELEN|nr:unnamed protein product [Meloidogyne enterolobii]
MQIIIKYSSSPPLFSFLNLKTFLLFYNLFIKIFCLFCLLNNAQTKTFNNNNNNQLKQRMCFQCHMPIQCKSGFCFGDYCVKSIVANKYVSKGCENKTKNGGNYFEGRGNEGRGDILVQQQNFGESFYVSVRSLEEEKENQLIKSSTKYPNKSNSNKMFSSLGVAVPNGCIKMNVFGQPNIICYCNDADYCNGGGGGGRNLKKQTIIFILIIIFIFFINI